MSKKKKQLKAVQAAKMRKKRRNKRRKRIFVLTAEVIILTFLLGTAYVMAKYDKIQRVEIDSENVTVNEGAVKEGYTTVALFGGDSREGQLGAGTHADTIIIASIDNKTKEIRLVSIYRDTFLKQKDDKYNKANSAYFRGGPEEAISMLNENLDLDIEDYVTVDFKALVDTIDLMGGIEIDIQEEEVQYMNEFLQETADVAGTEANFIEHAGEQKLDGAQAVTYARIRSTAGGDYKRTERQRLVIEKIFEKAVKTKISTINKIIDKVFEQVSTSFSLKEALGLAAGVADYQLGETAGFPFEKQDDVRYKNCGSVVVAQGLAENVQELHTFLYPNEEEKPVSDTVQQISDDIAYLTGVTRPKELDEEKTEGEETSDTSVGEEMTSEEVDSEEQ
ncbi:putative uncharacterized protein [Dorea sp. CAG:317]|jgi:hypothetical protein|nr:putative uncharacterized protein [Dorea sp. CAG:317]